MEKEQIKIEIRIGIGWLVGIKKFAKRLWSNRISRRAVISVVVALFLLGSYEGINAAGAYYFITRGKQEFGQKNYQEALPNYEKADQFWNRTLILKRIRVSPTAWRVSFTKQVLARLNELNSDKELASDNSSPKKNTGESKTTKTGKSSDTSPTTKSPSNQQSEEPNGNSPADIDYPEQQQYESYEYNDYYPIILSLSDNKGNTIKSSDYNGYDSSINLFLKYGLNKTGTKLAIGIL